MGSKHYISIAPWLLVAVGIALVVAFQPKGWDGIVLFTLLNAVAVGSAANIIAILGVKWTASERWLGGALVWTAIITLVEFLPGMARILTVGWVTLCLLVVWSASYLLRRHFRPRHGEKALTFPEAGRGWESRLVWIACLVMGAVLLRQIVFAAIQPPTWWDSLAHHLPVPAHWLQTCSLDLNPAFGLFTYPHNTELLYLWFMMPFHGEQLVNFVQLVFLLPLVLSVLVIAERLSISRSAVVAASSFFVLSPYYLEQTVICYNEIIVVGLFMSAMAFLLGYGKYGGVSRICLAGTALGIALGADFLSLVLMPLALVMCLCVFGIGKRPGGEAIRHAAAFAIMLVLFGSYWYVRNLIVNGNPLYPVEVSLLGHTIFAGPQTVSTVDLVEQNSFAYSLHDIYGVVFVTSVTASLCLCGIAALRSRVLTQKVFFALPGLLFLIWYVMLPVRELRYLMLLLPFAALAWSRLITESRGRARMAHYAFLCAWMLVQTAVWLPNYWWLIWLIAGAAATIVHGRERTMVLLASGLRLEAFGRAYAFAGVVAIACAFVLPRLNAYRESIRYAEHYKGPVGEAWQWIDEHTSNSLIAYSGTNKSYPLYGPDLRNSVIHVPTGIPPDEPAVETRAMFERWKKTLVYSGAEYLFISKMDSSTYMQRATAFPSEKRWAEADPETFRTIFMNDYVTVYRVCAEADRVAFRPGDPGGE